jgi:hypothetical protein
MASAQPLQRAHGCSITLELSIQGTLRSFSGRGRYADGKLWIDVKDDAGDFTLCLEEATFDGELLAQGDSYLIRLGSH